MIIPRRRRRFLGEGVSEGEPFDSMTDNEEEVAAIDGASDDQGSRGER